MLSSSTIKFVGVARSTRCIPSRKLRIGPVRIIGEPKPVQQQSSGRSLDADEEDRKRHAALMNSLSDTTADLLWDQLPSLRQDESLRFQFFIERFREEFVICVPVSAMKPAFRRKITDQLKSVSGASVDGEADEKQQQKQQSGQSSTSELAFDQSQYITMVVPWTNVSAIEVEMPKIAQATADSTVKVIIETKKPCTDVYLANASTSRGDWKALDSAAIGWPRYDYLVLRCDLTAVVNELLPLMQSPIDLARPGVRIGLPSWIAPFSKLKFASAGLRKFSETVLDLYTWITLIWAIYQLYLAIPVVRMVSRPYIEIANRFFGGITEKIMEYTDRLQVLWILNVVHQSIGLPIKELFRTSVSITSLDALWSVVRTTGRSVIAPLRQLGAVSMDLARSAMDLEKLRRSYVLNLIKSVVSSFVTAWKHGGDKIVSMLAFIFAPIRVILMIVINPLRRLFGKRKQADDEPVALKPEISSDVARPPAPLNSAVSGLPFVTPPARLLPEPSPMGESDLDRGERLPTTTSSDGTTTTATSSSSSGSEGNSPARPPSVGLYDLLKTPPSWIPWSQNGGIESMQQVSSGSRTRRRQQRNAPTDVFGTLPSRMSPFTRSSNRLIAQGSEELVGSLDDVDTPIDASLKQQQQQQGYDLITSVSETALLGSPASNVIYETEHVGPFSPAVPGSNPINSPARKSSSNTTTTPGKAPSTAAVNSPILMQAQSQRVTRAMSKAASAGMA